MAKTSAVTQALDNAWVRRKFLGLDTDEIFFDNAGGSQILSSVADRIVDWYRHSNVQLGASYARSLLSSDRLQQAQISIASLIGSADASEIVIGPSATQLVFNLSQSLAQTFVPGDEIIVSDADHAANVGPWLRLEKQGIIVRHWPIDPVSGRLDVPALERLLTPRTRLVCFTHCSNVVGAIEPASELVRRIHDAGALVLIDGVAFAPHRQVDVRAFGADFYLLSLYKVFGPHLAVLHITKDVFESLPGINHPFIPADDLPYKLQPGHANYELTWAAAGIPDYLSEVGKGDSSLAWQAIAQHESELARRLLGWLASKTSATVIGSCTADYAERIALVSFTVRDKKPEELVLAADRAGIGIRHGHFYSPWLIQALGLAETGGVIRVSMAHYNNLFEVDRLIDTLDPLFE